MTDTNPKKMKVAELRSALQERGQLFVCCHLYVFLLLIMHVLLFTSDLAGLDTSGLKGELVQRLESALEDEEFGDGPAPVAAEARECDINFILQ
jgi:hypothetical protein